MVHSPRNDVEHDPSGVLQPTIDLRDLRGKASGPVSSRAETGPDDGTCRAVAAVAGNMAGPPDVEPVTMKSDGVEP